MRIVPGQTFKDPFAVIAGTVGAEDALTLTGAEVPVQDPLPVFTVNEPVVETVID